MTGPGETPRAAPRETPRAAPREAARGHVVLGVCGGIAAYKAVEVLRGFQKAGLDVRCCLTENAARFVAPLTFAAISGHPVSSGRLGDGASDADMAHVEVTRGAALFVIAPLTANTLAKLAVGLADDWLTTHALASQAPLLLAPAMNVRMWSHPAVQANVKLLESRGARFVAPGEGDLACGEVGAGRLAEPADIVAAALRLLRGPGDLDGLSVLVTSGPTLEDVDDVRFLGNRSSGRMGHALAEAARARGAEVVLVSGPVAIPAPEGCEVVAVRSAEEMATAVRARLPHADVAFFAAAVADFKPRRRAGKIRRTDEEAPPALELERTRDVLAESIAARTRALLVGFAAEVGDAWEDAAREKWAGKGCDMLVANRVDGPGSAFDAEQTEVVVLGPEGAESRIARAPKRAVADELLDLAIAGIAARAADESPTLPGRAFPRFPRGTR